MITVQRLALGALLSVSCMGSAVAQVSGQSYDPSQPKTRAQVTAALDEWFAAGYAQQPWIYYPENALAASRIVVERHAQAQATGVAAQ